MLVYKQKTYDPFFKRGHHKYVVIYYWCQSYFDPAKKENDKTVTQKFCSNKL